MPKVHPDAAVAPEPSRAPPRDQDQEVLTVWRKSLLFNCDGFTVFDANGDLAFRVDCYGSGRHTEVVLMDAAGKPLLTVRRKRRLISFLALEHWVIYDGDAAAAAGKAKPLLSVRRHVSLRRSSNKTLAHVTPVAAASAAESSSAPFFVVEGSYGRRACAVRDARGDAVVAQVQRKESPVGDEVFRLVADPCLGAALAMGLVIALDEMFRGGGGGRGAARSLLRRTWSV